jgi:hypothetical protein
LLAVVAVAIQLLAVAVQVGTEQPQTLQLLLIPLSRLRWVLEVLPLETGAIPYFQPLLQLAAVLVEYGRGALVLLVVLAAVVQVLIVVQLAPEQALQGRVMQAVKGPKTIDLVVAVAAQEL